MASNALCAVDVVHDIKQDLVTDIFDKSGNINGDEEMRLERDIRP